MSCTTARGADLPRLALRPCTAPPVVDGVLDDPCWRGAPQIGGFSALGSESEPRTDATTGLLTHDDRWLYLGFVCRNPEMGRVAQTEFDHDGAVSEEDSVEVFLDPGTEGALCYHYRLSFANVRAERRVAGGESDSAWDVPWRSATRRSGEGWQAEIALPLSILAEGGDPGKLRANFGRNQVVFTPPAPGAKSQRQRVHSCWAPVQRSFREPDRFGRLDGLEKLRPVAPFLPGIAGASVGAYAGQPAKMSYPVTVDVRNHARVRGRIAVVVLDSPAVGEAGRVERQVVLAGGATRRLRMEVPVASPAEREVTLLLEDPATREALQSSRIKGTSLLVPMEAPLLDRNYYTGEARAVVLCRLGLPPSVLAGSTLSARDAAGELLSEVKDPRPETRLPIPLASLPLGEHSLTIAVRSPDGSVVASRSAALTKKRPHPQGEVKIDQVSRVVLRDGKPFLPFGVYFACHARTPAGLEQHLKWVAEAGFNSIGQWSDTDPENAGEFMALAQKHGLAVVDSAGTYLEGGGGYKDYTGPYRPGIARIIRGTEAVKDYPNLLAHYTIDEPANVARHIGSFDKVMEDCELLYKMWEERDGYHPVFMLYAPPIPPGESATRWSHILGFDRYMFAGLDYSFYGTPNYLGGYIAQLDQRAAGANRVTWAVPLAERLDPRRTPRGIFPAEHRSQAYLALIHGAKGFFYFVYSSFSHSQSWEALSDLARQMNALAPVVLTPKVPQEITYTPGSCDAANMKFTDVQAALFQDPAGGYLLLAANSRYYPVDVTYALPGLGRKGTVKRLFSTETCELKGDTFSDRLEWCGVRAYHLDFERPPKLPVAIAIRMKAHPDQALKEERANTATLRLGKRNAMVNPSFEEQSLPGCPDFVSPYRLEGRPAIGEPGALLSTDTGRPFHGRYSLRVTRRIQGDGAVCWGFFGIAYPPKLEAPTPYVLSFYMRAAREGDRVWVRADMEPSEQTFTLTTEWKRYSMSGLVKPDRFRDKSLLICPSGEDTTVWFDAFQMEPGAEPTPFTEE
ncbi:MAG: hypothetical protein HY321_20710 [Armatimonadetes bacterium]|nr:hypothetical protein [Armatimonadota bacterium]